MHTPNFKISQQLANKTLEIEQQEIARKTTMRNYSALNMPVKGKMQLQILNSEHGITAYERARMALKLLVNYGKKKEFDANRLEKEREQVSLKNAAIAERVNSELNSPKEED